MLFEVRDSIKSLPPVLPACNTGWSTVGRLVEWKRVDMLLRVFARLRKRFSDAELLIIGNGPQEQALKACLLQLGIAPNVTFLGAIHDPKTLGQYLMASTIYVLAGIGGLSINDAMCFGLPIVCSVGDGTEKVLVRDEVNGKYFRDGDEDDLADNSYRYLFDNPELCKRMGEKSTEIIRNEVNIHTVALRLHQRVPLCRQTGSGISSLFAVKLLFWKDQACREENVKDNGVSTVSLLSC